MLVHSLALRDFRSYQYEDLTLEPGLNVLVGPNGAGKTNLLEAIHVGVQGYPLRTRRDALTIRLGAATARIAVSGRRRSGSPFATMVVLDRTHGKRASLDGRPIDSLEELRRAFPTLAFTPDRLAVVRGGPLVRRTFLDRMIGRIMPARCTLPAEYGSAVSQRNAALRRAQLGISSTEVISPWTDAVVRLGGELDRARSDLLETLASRLEGRAAWLGLSGMSLAYRPSPATADRLAALLRRDIERGTTGAGPHLADVEILLRGRDLRTTGSQGEQRLAVLALLLAELDVLLELREEPPLLLLDDVLSELDDLRRAALLESIPDTCQTVLTTTSLGMLPDGGPAPSLVVDVSGGRAVRR